MIAILSQMGGLARGLPRLNIDKLRQACSGDEIKAWEAKASGIVGELRIFVRRLKGDGANGEETLTER